MLTPQSKKTQQEILILQLFVLDSSNKSPLMRHYIPLIENYELSFKKNVFIENPLQKSVLTY